MHKMTRGQHLTYCISFALGQAQKVVRGDQARRANFFARLFAIHACN
jgi:hypothetical protein